MDYKEAVKSIQAKKPKENFLVIQLSYDTRVILPYQEGMSFIASLSKAERFADRYGHPKRIEEYKRDDITVNVMSHSEYERIKIAGLLNVDPEELLNPELAA